MTSSFLNSLPPYLTPQTLLARLTNLPISEQDLTPSLIFSAASVTLLSGVMMMDGGIEPEEIAHLQMTIRAWIDADIRISHFIPQLILGIKQHQVYLDPRLFLVLAEPLDLPQRMLLMGLGYSMATADGHLSDRERMYLRAIAQRLRVTSEYLTVLEASATEQPCQTTDAVCWEVACHLDPASFRTEEPLFRLVAQSIFDNLPTEAIAVGA